MPENKISNIIKEDCLSVIDRLDLSQLKNKRILLTGSNGLLGKYLAHIIYFGNKTYGLNCKLFCVSLHGPDDKFRQIISEDIKAISADLTQPFDFKGKIDFIFHAACYAQPKKFLDEKLKTISLNVDALRYLLELAKHNNAKFMYFSSAGVYGEIPPEMLPAKESFCGNVNATGSRAAYAESKRLGETLCSVYRNDFGVKTYIARISHAYGPGTSINDERVMGNFIKKAFIEKKIRMLDSGNSVKAFGYVTDIIYMLLQVMLWGKELVYNIGGIHPVTIRALADEVAKNCGGVKVITPKKIAKDELVGTDYTRVRLDISRFIAEFGDFNFVTFSEGIKRTVAWNIEEFNLLKPDKEAKQA